MNFLVVGATGRTGRLVVEQAIARGHQLTAIVRKPFGLNTHDRLKIVIGDPLRVADLTAVAGHDAVISCLGQRSPRNPRVLQDAAAAMIEAMSRSDVRRYLVISQGLLFPSRNPIISVLRKILARHVADSVAMERLIQTSDLDWTIVRPPRLQSGGRQAGYRTSIGKRPNGPSAMQRTDLAAFLLDEAQEAGDFRTVVGITSARRIGRAVH